MKTSKSKFSSYFGAAILSGAPGNSAAPSISGTAQVGQTLTGADGTWSGSPTFVRHWLINGIVKDSATGSTTYVPVSADVGKAITYRVRGTNVYGTKAASSAATAAVIA